MFLGYVCIMQVCIFFKLNIFTLPKICYMTFLKKFNYYLLWKVAVVCKYKDPLIIAVKVIAKFTEYKL